MDITGVHCGHAKIAQDCADPGAVADSPAEDQRFLEIGTCLLIVAQVLQHNPQAVKRSALAAFVTDIPGQGQRLLEGVALDGSIALFLGRDTYGAQTFGLHVARSGTPGQVERCPKVDMSRVVLTADSMAVAGQKARASLPFQIAGDRGLLAGCPGEVIGHLEFTDSVMVDGLAQGYVGQAGGIAHCLGQRCQGCQISRLAVATSLEMEEGFTFQQQAEACFCIRCREQGQRPVDRSFGFGQRKAGGSMSRCPNLPLGFGRLVPGDRVVG